MHMTPERTTVCTCCRVVNESSCDVGRRRPVDAHYGDDVTLTATPSATTPVLPDGLVAIVKRECATCVMVVPVLQRLAAEVGLTVYTQDDPSFPEGVVSVHDVDLAVSWHHDIETV